MCTCVCHTPPDWGEGVLMGVGRAVCIGVGTAVCAGVGSAVINGVGALDTPLFSVCVCEQMAVREQNIMELTHTA